MHTHSVQGCLSLARNCECVSRMSRAPTSGGGGAPSASLFEQPA